MITREEDGYWLELQESISVHHESMFAAITTPAGLARWYPMKAEVDLRTGGQIVFCWDEKCTKKMTRAILDFDEGGRITWDWITRREGRHAPVYWTVEPDVEKGSIVRMRQGPFRRDEDGLIDLVEEGITWRYYLSNLRSSFEAKFDVRAHRPL